MSDPTASDERLRVISTDAPPSGPSRKTGDFEPALTLMDIDLIQALYGRAPSVATGAKRMRPDCLAFTLQGDGDMLNEGLQEVIHTAARGESVTCILLNNGVFGETGGHMTATTVLGQRTKNTIDGRDAKGVARVRRFLDRAFSSQMKGQGFAFVEILTMCPTGWFLPTAKEPSHLDQELGAVHEVGEIKKDGVLIERGRTTKLRIPD